MDSTSTFELSETEQSELRDIVAKMLQPGKGILAGDDPPGKKNLSKYLNLKRNPNKM